MTRQTSYDDGMHPTIQDPMRLHGAVGPDTLIALSCAVPYSAMNNRCDQNKPAIGTPRIPQEVEHDLARRQMSQLYGASVQLDESMKRTMDYAFEQLKGAK